MMKFRLLPGLQNVDEAIKVNIAAGIIRGAGIKNILSTSLGFGGQNSALIFSQYSRGEMI